MRVSIWTRIIMSYSNNPFKRANETMNHDRFIAFILAGEFPSQIT